MTTTEKALAIAEKAEAEGLLKKARAWRAVARRGETEMNTNVAKRTAKKPAKKAEASKKEMAVAALRKAGKKGIDAEKLVAAVYGSGTYADHAAGLAGVLLGVAKIGSLTKTGRGAEAVYVLA